MTIGICVTWWLFCMGYGINQMKEPNNFFHFVGMMIFCVVITPASIGDDIAKSFNSSKNVEK